ncbi:MAG: acyl carrier protein [Nitrospina sp.]|jgi:acyl carrier protein|nr:acyl carrier protein [Nitrospina sp.]MBT3508471.1 acyl carrier protein [Nitrospina sp.]MBT3875247.1 acyl carrier protein [Nitrospina sp.]MBT4048668.1 acyl carrier protein [Nitrospina sp.]MBT4559096.1 acyl carrier protein [Nitrospina sp.]
MQITEIKSQLKNFFEEEFPNPGASLTDDTNLLDDWFVDSFGIVNTTLFLEEKFGVEISRADINAITFRSIETLSQYVANQLKDIDES